jgi:membrane-associated phospholipid phosphatase
MANEKSEVRKIAKIVSNILHPYVVFPLVVALVACQVSSVPETWVKWMLTVLLPAYLLPLLYMQTRVIIVARTTGTQVTHRSFFREQPNEMLLLACLFGIPSTVILCFLGSPPDFIAAMVGVAATALLIALVNRVYRASFHLALLTSMLMPLVIILALPSLVIAPFILLLGLSRYHLGEHTPAQLVAGFLIGLVVSGATFWGFGLLG